MPTTKKTEEPVTCSIPQAAKKLGISRNSGYAAALRGEIPTIKIGRRLLVPKAALERLLVNGNARA